MIDREKITSTCLMLGYEVLDSGGDVYNLYWPSHIKTEVIRSRVTLNPMAVRTGEIHIGFTHRADKKASSWSYRYVGGSTEEALAFIYKHYEISQQWLDTKN